MRVEEHTTTIDDVPVFYRSAGGDGSDAAPGAGSRAAGGDGRGAARGGAESEAGAPQSEAGAPQSDESGTIVYLHDAAMSSDDFLPFLECTGGVAPDLIGFGRSGKGGHLNYSPDGLVDFVERFLAALGLERVRLVGHGWGGAIGLLLAWLNPTQVARLVLIDPVPLLPGVTWPRVVRWWRKAMIGELVMGATTRRLLERQLQAASTQRWSEARLSSVWEHFDQGTQRALLRLHRAADEAWLSERAEALGDVKAPTLIVWGDGDPWFAPSYAEAYAARLPNATVEHVAGAGHWPWLERPELIPRVAEFLAGR